MINVIDLRIGNLLFDFNGRLVSVLSIKEGGIRCVYKRTDTNTNHVSLYHNYELIPIGLNLDILEKLGFFKDGIFYYHKDLPSIFRISISNGFYMSNILEELKFLHEIQNVIYTITKKEIKYNDL